MKLGGEARRRRKHKQKNAVLDARRNWRLSYEEMCAHVILECIVVCSSGRYFQFKDCRISATNDKSCNYWMPCVSVCVSLSAYSYETKVQ